MMLLRSFLVVLAHLSQRLIGELIVYVCSVVYLSVVRRSSVKFSNISKTAEPIEAKVHGLE